MSEVNDYLEDKYPIKFNGYQLRIEMGKYQSNNRTAIRLFYWDENDHIEYPYGTATVNVEHADLEEDEVVIKDYSENEGILQLLIKHDIIAKPHDKVTLGHALGYICQLIDS